MQNAFATVVLVVGVVGVVGALVALLTSRRSWESLGRGGLAIDSDPCDPRTGATAERDTEIRQMLDARNARRRRRGEPELDVEAELARLTEPPPPAAAAVDDGLGAEIRQLVIARNLRRARRGQPPLDVEAEVARELRRVGGSHGPRTG